MPEKNWSLIKNRYRGRNAMVLGATGFIGRWVARLLSEAGADLILPVRDLNRAKRIFEDYSVRGRSVEIDLTEEGIAELLAESQPDITFNLVGYGIDRNETDEASARRINAYFVEELCSAVSGLPPTDWGGPRLVHAGTAMEYGAAKGDLNEDTECLPTTLYGHSKLEGTLRLTGICNESALSAVVCRLFAVYGPGEHPNRLVPMLFGAAQSKGPIKFTKGAHKRDFCYVGDVAEGLMRVGASKARSGSIINIASGNLTSIRTFIETIARATGIEPSRLEFGALPTRQEEMDHSPVSNFRLRETTGWVPGVDVESGLRKTMRFIENQ